jgi:hypothetical protein
MPASESVTRLALVPHSFIGERFLNIDVPHRQKYIYYQRAITIAVSPKR